MIWLYAGVAVAFLALGAYAKIEHSGKLAAQAETQALGAKIEQQNAAVQQLKADGDRRIAEATKGVAKAKAGTARARTEAERLRTLAAQPTSLGLSECPAGQAVGEIRKGLAAR